MPVRAGEEVDGVGGQLGRLPVAFFRYLNQPDVFQRVYSTERVVRTEIHDDTLCGALRIVIALGINDDSARHYCRFHLVLRIEEDLGMRSLRVCL